MKIRKETKKKILKIMFLTLILSAVVLTLFSNSFATESEEPEKQGGIVSFVLMVFRGLIAIIVLLVVMVLGMVLTGEFVVMSIETFLFNRVDMTSLKVFTGSRTNYYANSIYDNVAKWFVIFFALAVALQLLVLIYIAISTALRTLRQDPEKEAEIKKMFKDFLIGVVVLFAMAIFVISLISINNVIIQSISSTVDSMAEGTPVDGAMKGSLASLTMKVFQDVFQPNITQGTIALILLIILGTMAAIFFVYYIRRFFKVAFLIMIAPLVAVTFSIDRRRGAAQKLMVWTKSFAYTVLIQAVHAIIYLSLVSVIVLDMDVNSTGFIPTVVLIVSGIKFIWDAELIIGELFGIQADRVQGSAAILVAAMTTAGKLKGGATALAEKAPQLAVTGTGAKSKASTATSSGSAGASGAAGASGTAGAARVASSARSKLRRESKEGKVKRDSFAAKKPTKPKSTKPILKGLGTSIGEAIGDKAGKGVFKRGLRAAGRGALKVSGASIMAIASHATPKYGMVQASIVGYRATGALMDKKAQRKERKMYKEPGKKHLKTLDDEAAQLLAIDSRKEKLGKDTELPDEGETVKKIEEAVGEEGTTTEETKEQEERIKGSSDTEKAPEGAERHIEQELKSYVQEIVEKPREELEDAYFSAKQKSVDAFVKRTGKSKKEAETHVDELQKGILKEKDFNYETLEDVDRNLLHKFLNVVQKQKIEYFEAKSGEDKYKSVVTRAIINVHAEEESKAERERAKSKENK